MPIFRKPPTCLFDVVDHLIHDLNLESKYFVEIDVPEEIGLPAAIQPLQDLLISMIEHSTAHTPEGGELSIIGWQSDQMCEIEVADSGPAVQARDRTIPVASTLAGAELSWQDCPQGGAAVTARFNHQTAQRRVA